jgi:hypothetical protein
MKKRSLIYENAKQLGLFRLLFEQEEEDEEEKASSEDEEETAEKDTEDEDTDASKEDDKEVELKPFSIDNELESLLIKAEEEAKTSAKTSAASIDAKSIEESKRKMSIKRLYEASQNAKIIDVDHFANRVARIVKNYDSLIDMEQLILKRAVEFLQNHYDEDTNQSFQDALRQMHGLELLKPISAPGTKLGVPNAVGARQATA